MGGKGSGGHRFGAGRKKKTDEERFVDGNAGHRGRVIAHPSTTSEPPPVPVVDEADAPNDLTLEERRAWLALAPHALQNGTLVPATSVAFVLLCKNIVRERKYGESLTECGTANHRGLIQRVEGGLDAFQLRPQGRRMPSADPVAKPASPLDRFLKKVRA